MSRILFQIAYHMMWLGYFMFYPGLLHNGFKLFDPHSPYRLLSPLTGYVAQDMNVLRYFFAKKFRESRNFHLNGRGNAHRKRRPRLGFSARAPPSNLILVHNNKIQIGESKMKEINLRKYYPPYVEDKIVADLLKDFSRAEDAYRIRTYRHKAVYSLDLMNEIREFPDEGLLPEELLEQSSMKELLYKGLQTLPEKQCSRLIAYYFLGMSKTEIASIEGSRESSVREGLQRGLRALERFFEENLK